ncbi:unnamed protein product [Paramecium sonneborni]|uniref:Uncharacterized protein n=1 Tax=Paramecium sonneborni TaxID=65129 RepID=A0A8S1PJN5_9CILI|nr:unnamed protein product [Paramecium sonneborni]
MNFKNQKLIIQNEFILQQISPNTLIKNFNIQEIKLIRFLIKENRNQFHLLIINGFTTNPQIISLIIMINDKIRLVTKVREQINQVKSVLNRLFYIRNQYQLNQQQIRLDKMLNLENSPKSSENCLFKSAIHLYIPQEYHISTLLHI